MGWIGVGGVGLDGVGLVGAIPAISSSAFHVSSHQYTSQVENDDK